jgi:hypothetical protein
MRLAGIGSLGLDLVVVHQIAVTATELTVFRKVVNCRAEAVAAMPARHTSQLPKGLLEPAAHRLERLGEADRDELPIRVREREVIQQVIERFPGDGNAQCIHAGEVRGAESARVVNLRKDDALAGAVEPAPIPYAPLEGASLRVGESTGIALLEPAEQGERPQPRFGFQAGLHVGPDVGERVGPSPPIARR